MNTEFSKYIGIYREDIFERVIPFWMNHSLDREYGEWFGYCDRRGHLTHTCKGGNYKGCFHVPRFLLMAIQAIER